MPIRIQSDLPAKAELEDENIFVMDENRALSQDFRERTGAHRSIRCTLFFHKAHGEEAGCTARADGCHGSVHVHADH